MPQDGCALLHRQGQGPSRTAGPQKVRSPHVKFGSGLTLAPFRTATVVAFTGVNKEDTASFQKLQEVIRESYNNRYDESRRRWGGGALGAKSRAIKAQKEKAVAAAEAARAAGLR